MSVIHFRFDPNKRQYIECTQDEFNRLGDDRMMEDAYYAPAPKKLEDVGTRFDHINDLLDFLGDGLLAVTKTVETYKNENDILRKKRIEESIVLVQIYRDKIANVDGQQCAFNTVLDSCVPVKGVLEQIRRERVTPEKPNPPARPLEDDNLQGA